MYGMVKNLLQHVSYRRDMKNKLVRWIITYIRV